MRVGLLKGLRVLETGESVAVAFSGKVLADLGADVVMIEPPGGSPLRRLPPFYQDIPGPGRSVLHNWLCANKRSVTLNLTEDRGRAILRELARRVDALVHGQSAALDTSELRNANPGLTLTMISPFGCDGPYAAYRANDLTLFALSGISYYLASPVDDPPSTPPKRNPGYQVGLVAGLSAAIATLWGLAAGKKKGQGITVDVSEWEAFTHLLYEHTGWLSEGKLARVRKRAPGAVITVVGGLVWCLPCSDGWVMISPRENHQFMQWSEVIGEPEWASQPKFATPRLREQNAWEIYERSAAWTKLRKKTDVYLAAQERKVAGFPVSQMSDLPELEQLKHRGFWTEIPHPILKDLMYPGLPVRFEGVDAQPSVAAPQAGEHTVEICTELGIPAEEIKDLWQLQVI